MMLANGKYRTAAGSTVEISGKHSGVASVAFDWVEEPGACPDCEPDPYPVEGYLTWRCAECGGGSAPLTRVEAGA